MQLPLPECYDECDNVVAPLSSAICLCSPDTRAICGALYELAGRVPQVLHKPRHHNHIAWLSRLDISGRKHHHDWGQGFFNKTQCER